MDEQSAAQVDAPKVFSQKSLRLATLGRTKQFKREAVEFNGEQFEVRQPSVRVRGELMRAAKVASNDPGVIDISELQVQAVIACVYVPGTEEKVFNDTDRDELLNQPPHGFVDALAEVALRLMNVDSEVARKN